MRIVTVVLLFQAHQQYRRAEAHLKYKRFDEAMQCHHNAAELLLDAMKTTTSSVALESITLQHSYHLKQKDLIKIKKEQYARVKKAMENLKHLGKDQSLPCSENSKIQVAIYRNMYETDSLLEVLSSKKDKSDVAEKEQQVVVEEIQHLNRNLRSLVEQLVLQVEVLKDENMTLNERVNYFEKERNRYLNIQVSDFIHQNNFSNISLSNEAFPREPLPADLPSVSHHPPKVLGTGVARPVQQPLFDLSAFKDD